MQIDGIFIGHGEDKPGDSERSPVFLQFIDCVWQIMKLVGLDFKNLQSSFFLKLIIDHLKEQETAF